MIAQQPCADKSLNSSSREKKTSSQPASQLVSTQTFDNTQRSTASGGNMFDLYFWADP